MEVDKLELRIDSNIKLFISWPAFIHMQDEYERFARPRTMQNVNACTSKPRTPFNLRLNAPHASLQYVEIEARKHNSLHPQQHWPP